MLDGCGHVINCGTCKTGEVCGGGGGPNLCGTQTCTPGTCTSQGKECGQISDGCGKVLDCGSCPSPDSCGGGGVPNQCGCKAKSCADKGATCGVIADGCGHAVDCGVCQGASKCNNHQCECTPKTCSDYNDAKCGTYPDGCTATGTIDCGTCSANQVCNQGQCASSCTKTTCADQGAQCGQISDGCGGLLVCGGCTAPQTCGGGGTPNVCGCSPTTCAAQGKDCGNLQDGCGNMLVCGACAPPQTCGGGGTAGVCGCTPTTCQAKGKNCGSIPDGCNGPQLNCGSCLSGQGCVDNVCKKCFVPTCAANYCGTFDNGCGGVATCSCSAGGSVCDQGKKQCVAACLDATLDGGTSGICKAPDVCDNGTCCTPSCPVGSCGVQDDGCDGKIACGPCP